MINEGFREMEELAQEHRASQGLCRDSDPILLSASRSWVLPTNPAAFYSRCFYPDQKQKRGDMRARQGRGRKERASEGEEEKEGADRQAAGPVAGDARSLAPSAPHATSSGSWAADGFLKQQQQLPVP